MKSRTALPWIVLGGIVLLAVATVAVLRPLLTRAAPPATAALGDTWMRPADEATMVYVPGGTFTMGSDDARVDFLSAICSEYNRACYTCSPGRSVCHRQWFDDEQPAHPVTLDAFWLDRTEVTNAQYAACVAAGACSLPSETGFYLRSDYFHASDYASHPVLYVSWQQAAGYCEWAGARLPTEAEWEYAAAGPDGLNFPWGAEFDGTRLNFCDDGCWLPGSASAWHDGFEETAPAGSFPAGASWAGALDLAGNAAEWVADWYAADYYVQSPALNPQGPASGDNRVYRGGAWGLQPLYASTRYRSFKPADATNIYVGFRCARSAYVR